MWNGGKSFSRLWSCGIEFNWVFTGRLFYPFIPCCKMHSGLKKYVEENQATLNSGAIPFPRPCNHVFKTMLRKWVR